MADVYKMYALWYNQKWGVSVAFKSVNRTPLHPWRHYADTRMGVNEVLALYDKYVKAPKRKGVRVAIITGPYMEKVENPLLIIDVDIPPVTTKEEKNSLMKTFAKEGYVVVNTPRGFHLHVFLDKNHLPYILTISRIEENKPQKIGEGGCLFPHPWSTTPSLRTLGDNRWFRYAFVLPDGTRISSYDARYLKDLIPIKLPLSDVIEDLSLLLSANIHTYNPMVTGTPPVKISEDQRELTRKRAVFHNLREFLSTVGELPLPRCVAWVLYHYLEAIGDEYSASRLAVVYEDITRKVPYGKRFLTAAAVALFLAHVIEWIKFDEIIEILQYGIEDWPHDEGMALDRKLRYLFLASEEGNVYPRYGGLGSLSPMIVLGTEFCLENCMLGRECKGRNPWRPFIRLYKKRAISRIIYDVEEIVREEE